MVSFRSSGFGKSSAGSPTVGTGQRGSGTGGAGYPATPTHPATGIYAQPNAPQPTSAGTVPSQKTFTVIRTPSVQTYEAQAMQAKTAGNQTLAAELQRRANEEMQRRTTYSSQEQARIAEREQVFAKRTAIGADMQQRQIPFATERGVTKTFLDNVNVKPIFDMSDRMAAKVAAQGGGVTTYERGITQEGRPVLGIVRTMTTPQMTSVDESNLLGKKSKQYATQNISPQAGGSPTQPQNIQSVTADYAERKPTTEYPSPIKPSVESSNLVSPEAYNAVINKNVLEANVGNITKAPDFVIDIKQAPPEFAGVAPVTEAQPVKGIFGATSVELDKANQQAAKAVGGAAIGWRLRGAAIKVFTFIPAFFEGVGQFAKGGYNLITKPAEGLTAMASPILHPRATSQALVEIAQANPARFVGNVAGQIAAGEVTGFAVGKIPIIREVITTTTKTEVLQASAAQSKAVITTRPPLPPPSAPVLAKNIFVLQKTDVIAKTRTTLPSGRQVIETKPFKVVQKAEGYMSDRLIKLKENIEAAPAKIVKKGDVEVLEQAKPMEKQGQSIIKIITGEEGGKKLVFGDTAIRAKKGAEVIETRTQSYGTIAESRRAANDVVQKTNRIITQQEPPKAVKPKTPYFTPKQQAALGIMPEETNFLGISTSAAKEVASISTPVKDVVKISDKGAKLVGQVGGKQTFTMGGQLGVQKNPAAKITWENIAESVTKKTVEAPKAPKAGELGGGESGAVSKTVQKQKKILETDVSSATQLSDEVATSIAKNILDTEKTVTKTTWRGLNIRTPVRIVTAANLIPNLTRKPAQAQVQQPRQMTKITPFIIPDIKPIQNIDTKKILETIPVIKTITETKIVTIIKGGGIPTPTVPEIPPPIIIPRLPDIRGGFGKQPDFISKNPFAGTRLYNVLSPKAYTKLLTGSPKFGTKKIFGKGGKIW